ncbi:hypothetical protein CHS0354_012523 [Potamilus streckersoni]|uniref:Uncharacterized protein n=1 Tax=Potamilus streckersoni TaxID=2493646 RepID=A0AAE0W1W7_9BIVA|nr:hypothetical protein CHS0354_012523 [Potamilus streckersoni]
MYASLKRGSKGFKHLRRPAWKSCHTSMYENNQQILYSQSCESKLVCDALNSVPSIVGRKRATGLRTTCCDTPLCNNVTIGVH